jgi:hypothetical protein
MNDHNLSLVIEEKIAPEKPGQFTLLYAAEPTESALVLLAAFFVSRDRRGDARGAAAHAAS